MMHQLTSLPPNPSIQSGRAVGGRPLVAHHARPAADFRRWASSMGRILSLRNRPQIVAPLLLLTTCTLCLGQGLSDVADSHIEANVPAQKDFDPFLKRDLAAFFRESSTAPMRVEYQLLREGPTQTGIAYPKFYAWVKVFSGSRLSQEGAVRLAAIDKARFEVTQFVPKSDVTRDPQALARIFPAALIPSILEKSGVRQ